MVFSDDLSKPAFPFIEVAYVAIFFHAIGLNYFVTGLGFTVVPEHRLKDFVNVDDKSIVYLAWLFSFGLFLLASSFQLLRVYMRVIVSNELDIRRHEFVSECKEYRFYSIVLFLNYSLRLGAILLLLFIEISLYNRAEITAFFQTWSPVLLVFYCLLIVYSLFVGSFMAYWAKSTLNKANKSVGCPWNNPEQSDTAIITQARDTFWQSVGWFATDVIVFVAYGIIYWIYLPDGGQEASTLTVVLALGVCAFLSILVFVLEFIWPLIEDVKALLLEYSWIKTGLALVFAIGLWLSAEEWIGSLLIQRGGSQ